MELFHGSFVVVSEPSVVAGRENLDFGRGFYLTCLRSQAEAWAKVIASRRGRRIKPVISVFRFDREQAAADGVRFRVFESYDLEWLDYVVSCRRGESISADFEVVEGGVANDNVIDTVEDYEKGIITAEQALGQLRYKKVNHQLCILSQIVVDKYLHFVEDYSLLPEEDEV